MPRDHVWNSDGRLWTERVRPDDYQLGRMVCVHPMCGDQYFMRVLLKNVSGAKSFQDLLTVNGKKCRSCKDACARLELLEDDAQWDVCMEEAVQYKLPYALRELFCSILLHCVPSDPRRLFDKYSADMGEDFLYRRTAVVGLPQTDAQRLAENDLLLALNEILVGSDKSNVAFNLPSPDETLQASAAQYETEYDPNAQQCFATNHPLLNDEQRLIFDTLKPYLDEHRGGLFFVDSPAGCGKTFVANTFLAYVRQQMRIAVSTAMTGIAATLLTLATTAHKRFGWPRHAFENCTSNLSVDSKEARILKDADIIIIDEVSSMQCTLFDCLDSFCRLLMDCDEPMGGKLVVVMGDFRQGLPVIRHGSRAKVISSSIKSSELWPHVETLRLNRNMRVQRLIGSDSTRERTQELEEYAKWLLEIGNGTAPTPRQNIIEVPAQMLCKDPLELQEKVYPDFLQHCSEPDYLRKRAILAPTNDVIQDYNFKMVERLPGPITISNSIDECTEDEDKKLYDADFLNKINSSGIPPHRLAIKPHACIILIKNINVKRGFCNGTRLIVEKVDNHVIRARRLDGGRDPVIFIPRIPTICDESDCPAKFKRLQFPILGAYYLTFNRAQGQSLDWTGLLLPQSVFAHGLLYIGFSCCGDPNHVFVFADQDEFRHFFETGALDPTKTYTRNVVYPEIFYKNDNAY